MSGRADRRPLCSTCGDAWVQHQASDDGCWGRRCIDRPVGERCFAYAPPRTAAPAPPPPGQASLLAVSRPAVEALREGTFRHTVYCMVRHAGDVGMTDDEIEVASGRPHQSVSATRRSLALDGLLVDSRRQRTTRYGREATVWVSVD